MRIGFLSDIHSNLEALQVAVEKLESEKVEKIVCIGDIVGYGADPDKCVEIIKQKADVIVAGNHDWACVGKTDITYFNKHGKAAILWTSSALTPQHRSFLAELSLLYADRDWCAVHSTPSDPVKWKYVLSAADAIEQFGHFSQKICFIGHLHVPGMFTDNGEHFQIVVPHERESVEFRLIKDRRHIINIGSVGQPRDGDIRGSVAIYDAKAETVKLIRYEYPVSVTQQKIISAGLPPFLAERIGKGI